MWTRCIGILKVSTRGTSGTEFNPHIDCHDYPKKIRESVSFGGSRLYHIKATMILRVRVVLNTPEHGYSKGKSLQVGRIQRRQRYYGCMEPVSQPS